MNTIYKKARHIQDRITLLDRTTQSDKDDYKMRSTYYSSPQTKLDYGKTMSLFHDFGMNIREIKIPKFETKNQLYNWRTNRIKEFLSDD